MKEVLEQIKENPLPAIVFALSLIAFGMSLYRLLN